MRCLACLTAFSARPLLSLLKAADNSCLTPYSSQKLSNCPRKQPAPSVLHLKGNPSLDHHSRSLSVMALVVVDLICLTKKKPEKRSIITRYSFPAAWKRSNDTSDIGNNSWAGLASLRFAIVLCWAGRCKCSTLVTVLTKGFDVI